MTFRKSPPTRIEGFHLPATEKQPSTMTFNVKTTNEWTEGSPRYHEWHGYESDHLSEAEDEYEGYETDPPSEDNSSNCYSDVDDDEPEIIPLEDSEFVFETDEVDSEDVELDQEQDEPDSNDDLSEEEAELELQYWLSLANAQDPTPEDKPRKKEAHQRHYVHYRVTNDLDTIAEVDESLYAVDDDDGQVPTGRVPANSVITQKWVTNHTRSFYPSVDGLGVTPLFWRPVELLANCRELYWDGSVRTVKGKKKYTTFSSEAFPPRMNPLSTLGCHEKDALRAERIRHYYADQTDELGHLLPVAKQFFNRLRVLEFQRAVFDACVLPLHFLVRTRHSLTSADRRFIERSKLRILLEPAKFAFDLKRWAGVARAHWFGDRSIDLPNFLRGKPGWYLAQFSYVGRALPPPPRDPNAIMEYVDRLCSDPVPEHPDWRPFVKDYLEKFKPPREIDYRTDPSTSACFGYTRQAGGFTHAVQTLVSFGAALLLLRKRCMGNTLRRPKQAPIKIPFLNGLPKDLMSEKDGGVFQILNDPEFYPYLKYKTRQEGVIPTISGNDHIPFVEVALEDLESLAGTGGLSDLKPGKIHEEKIFSLCLRVAVHAVLKRVRAIPLLPIYAEEKGLKIRYPSMTLAAATLVYQIFRRAIDSHFHRDRHFSGGMGGPLARRVLRKRAPEEFFYSQDLSYATDLHPFWLTRTMYEEVLPHHPVLREWEPYFDKLFGPHQVVLLRPDEIPIPPTDNLRFTHALNWDGTYDLTHVSSAKKNSGMVNIGKGIWAGKGLDFTHPDPTQLQQAVDLVMSFHRWLEAVEELPSRYTTTSCSMGDATSFPGMAMLTAFAAAKADCSEYNGVGDDAELLFNDPSQRRVYDNTVEACGAKLSKGDPEKGKPNKIFQHPTKSILCEELRDSGRLLKTQHMSLWSAPPGGSKGHIDWFNQPSSAIQHLSDQGIPVYAGLWTKTCTFNYVLAAFRLGIPVGASVTYGGVGHPMLPPQAGAVNADNWAWLSALSRLTQYQLSSGTGLCPLPTGISGVSRTIVSRYIDGLMQEDVSPMFKRRLGDNPIITRHRTATLDTGEEVINPSFPEALDLMLGLVTSWEAYHRLAPTMIKTPKVTMIAAKLRRRFRPHRKSQYVAFDYQRTMEDLLRKQDVYLDHRLDLVPFDWDVRAYGLLQSSVDKDRSRRFAQQWEHLTQFRVDRAYVNPVMTTLHVDEEADVGEAGWG